MDIPQEVIISIAAALVAWLLARMARELQSIWIAYKNSKPTTPEGWQLQDFFELGWEAGEQLIEKHGITDREEVERRVLSFVNEYMIAQGFQPPARQMAEMLIKAIGRKYNEQRKAE